MSQPKRGEVWLIRFDPSIGDEIGKLRPGVVLSDPEIGRLKLRFVCPVTDWKDRFSDYDWFTELIATDSNGLSKKSGADAFQCKSISVERFQKKLGFVPVAQVEEIIGRLFYCLKPV